MAQRLTLQQIRDQIGLAADVTIGDNRYPNATVDLWINQEIQDVQKKRADLGTGDKSKTSVTITATDAVQGGGYLAREVVTLPADFLALKSAYVIDSGYRWQLQPMAESDKELLQENTRPLYYTVLDPTQTLEARLQLWPPADAAYTLNIEYFTEHPALSLVSDLWHFPSGCQDLVICGVPMKQLLGRDGMQEPEQVDNVRHRYQVALDNLQNDAKRDRGVLTMRNDRAFRRTVLR